MPMLQLALVAAPRKKVRKKETEERERKRRNSKTRHTSQRAIYVPFPPPFSSVSSILLPLASGRFPT